MEDAIHAKKLISDAKNICIIPSENEPESLISSLALFYTLRELGKNVNLISETFPDNLGFLVPSVDFVSAPKNFVISIPRSATEVSQVYYEKTDDNLKIHLTIEKGGLKKENISFYFQEAKPDLVITLGIKDFRKHLENKLDSFGFLLGSAVLNIDNSEQNLKFGQVNLVREASFSEILLEIIGSFEERLLNKNSSDCLFAALAIHYDNFRSKNAGKEIFELAAFLIKNGADNQLILKKLQGKQANEVNFWNMVFEKLKKEGRLSFASFGDEGENLKEEQLDSIILKIRDLGIQNNLLVTWQSHNSDAITRGFFYSRDNSLVERLSNELGQANKSDWVHFSLPGERSAFIKEKILGLLK